MSCHTWGYINVKSISQKDFEKIKSYCDDCADKILKDTTTAEELYELAISSKMDLTIEQVKESIERRKEKARNYKNNIENDRTLIRYYISYKYIDNEVYINYRCFLDGYIRVSNYPKGIFKSADEIIEMCESNDWEFAYWYDEHTGDIVRAYYNINEAKERINKIFNDYHDIIVEFG